MVMLVSLLIYVFIFQHYLIKKKQRTRMLVPLLIYVFMFQHY